MTKRSIVLAEARAAGYHDDDRTFTRLLVESRVARAALNAAWRSGSLALSLGMGCGCVCCRRRRTDDLAGPSGDELR